MLLLLLAVQFLHPFFLAAGASSESALLSAVQNVDDCPTCLALLAAGWWVGEGGGKRSEGTRRVPSPARDEFGRRRHSISRACARACFAFGRRRLCTMEWLSLFPVIRWGGVGDGAGRRCGVRGREQRLGDRTGREQLGDGRSGAFASRGGWAGDGAEGEVMASRTNPSVLTDKQIHGVAESFISLEYSAAVVATSHISRHQVFWPRPVLVPFPVTHIERNVTNVRNFCSTTSLWAFRYLMRLLHPPARARLISPTMLLLLLAVQFLHPFFLAAGASSESALLSAVQNVDDCPTCLALLAAVDPFIVHFPRPVPANPKVWKSRGRAPIRVVHLSDVHIDRMYTVGSEANCTKPICCRDFADSPAIPTEPAGPNGNSHCDSPVSLADSMLEEIESLNPVFSIFTGDVVEGAVWLVNQSEVTVDLEAFNAEMAAKLTAPIFPALGNHDSAPVNAFARTTSHTANNSQFVYDIQSAGWEQWINRTASMEVDHTSGSYSAKVPGMNLRIIAVNTQLWYKQNFWLYDSDVLQPDPNGIIAFLISALQAAEDAGERAWIIGHIPLGKEDTLVDQSNYYNQVLQRYINTIAGQFFGHSHKDQFEIAYSNYSEQTAANAVSVGLIGPALTPTSGNPAFKVYEIDPDTFEVMDSSVFFTNTSDPNFQITPTWGLFYSARDTYGPLVSLAPDEPLSPAFWHNLTEVFAANDTAFQMFNTFLSRGANVVACDGDCVNTTICDMRAFRSENNCDVPAEGFSLRKRAGVDTHDSDACEGKGLAHILSNMVLSV
ncbi:Metallo-dependent phosphatase-like protein [Mycena maculata]|uniref:Metallo-dependent phosphatase-like protein n=1 Tax=Mycena maculata TaxID=230809 RepID=A0AAD7MI01_9AGAR|nr:Metallo-dependent phosphatase-like protein [Mycena maculata]